MFEGWHLIGMFSEGEYADVGSWILHHNGEAALLEIPPGLTLKHVEAALEKLGSPELKLATASHKHEDHFDIDSWVCLKKLYANSLFLNPVSVLRNKLIYLGGEPLWLIPAPKHSYCDIVTIFRGVAMTGDIELGVLESVNGEVPEVVRLKSMNKLYNFPRDVSYRIHTVVSAHVNDIRRNVNWSELFDYRNFK